MNRRRQLAFKECKKIAAKNEKAYRIQLKIIENGEKKLEMVKIILIHKNSNLTNLNNFRFKN